MKRKPHKSSAVPRAQKTPSATTWAPQEFSVGARVTDPQHPTWGIGTVLDAIKLSEFPISPSERVLLHPRTTGQRLSIRFADGRTRIILSPLTPLRPATDDSTRNA